MNLALNARDAIVDRGELTISTREVTLDEEAVRRGAPSSGDYVSIDVTDRVVTISGVVPAPEQIRTIERIIKLTSGVDSVMNNLVVQE